jgi:hypothetical protein
MNLDELSKHFEAMGARAKVNRLESTLERPTGRRGFRRTQVIQRAPLRIDILNDRHGEYFQFDVTEEAPEVRVLQVAPKDRHLLLYADDGQRFLCGHDERHWFVAGIEEPVSTIRAAKQALMPETIRERVKDVAPDKVDNRRNGVFIRQGEWFFTPVEIDVPEGMILRNEPLRRNGRSKPHIAQELYRQGGETVYIVAGRTYTEQEFRDLRRSIPDVDLSHARRMVGNARVYVRGSVRHADHATVRLDGWHQVMINAEPATSTIAFLD